MHRTRMHIPRAPACGHPQSRTGVLCFKSSSAPFEAQSRYMIPALNYLVRSGHSQGSGTWHCVSKTGFRWAPTRTGIAGSSPASHGCLLVRRPSKSVLSSGKLSANAPEQQCHTLCRHFGRGSFPWETKAHGSTWRTKHPSWARCKRRSLAQDAASATLQFSVHLELSRDLAIPGCLWTDIEIVRASGRIPNHSNKLMLPITLLASRV